MQRAAHANAPSPVALAEPIAALAMPQSTDPTTGEPFADYAWTSDAALDAALDRAAAAFETWRATSFAERAAVLARVADALEADAATHGRRMTREMGKPLAQATAEAEKCAWACRVYAANAEQWLADEPRPSDGPDGSPGARRALVAYEPLGPLLAVMPWNYPYWQAIRAAAPALMAGNPVLLKHADNVLGCGDALTALFHDAGAGDAFQHLVLQTERVAGVIADDRLAAVTLTGSEAAGRAVGAQAGRAIKPCVLELGGSDAFVVLADADLDAAVEAGVASRTQNNGQSCIAAKRFLVEAPVAETFARRLVEAMGALTVGDPMDDGTDLGPLARRDLRDALHDQVWRAVDEGATLALGGTVPDGEGWFYPPTVLTGVAEGGVPFREELFGPVASVTVADDAAHAVRLANATRFGLGGSVWTDDRARGEALARQIRSGAVFVNAMTQSHPMLPFGGIGASGVGRELGREGARAFTNARTLWVQ